METERYIDFELGAFLLAFGSSMTPAFNAAAPYSPDGTNTLAGLHSPGFVNTFGICTSRQSPCAVSNLSPDSILLLIHGTADGDLYHLLNSHESAIIPDLPESDPRILPLGSRILETRCWR